MRAFTTLLILLILLPTLVLAASKDRFLTTSGGQTVRVLSSDNVETFANSTGAVAVGDAVYLSAAGTVAKASASTTSAPALGLVYELIDSTHCVVLTRGVFPAWTTGMTAGTSYFLAESAGTLQTTAVLGSGKLSQYVGTAISATDLYIQPQNISLQGTGGGQLIALDYTGALPAVSGANLTNLPPGGDGIGGSTGGTDNAVLRANGTGGSSAQASALICDDSGNLSGIGNITLSGTVDGVDVSAIPTYAQSSDAELSALAGVTSAANVAPYFIGSGTAGVYTLTQGGRALAGVSWSSGTQVPYLSAAGTAGMLTVGAASGLAGLDGSGRLSAYDGSQLTNLPGTGAINVQVFTSDGTWTKPSTGSVVRIMCIGAGGGGGGGAYNTVTGSPVYGGGGGAGGAYAELVLPLSALGSTETVTVGVGGPGGAGKGTAGNGNAGTAGEDTTFGAHVTAKGGAGGNGATGTNGTTNAASNVGGTSNVTIWAGGAGSIYSGSAGGGVFGGGGGGYGGPYSSGGSGSFNGGAGGAGALARTPTGATGGTAGTIGFAGTNYVAAGSGTSSATYRLGGAGGGGGPGNHANAAVIPNGANGGLYGGGGGGGGAGRVNTSGTGGTGADGICVVEVR